MRGLRSAVGEVDCQCDASKERRRFFYSRIVVSLPWKVAMGLAVPGVVRWSGSGLEDVQARRCQRIKSNKGKFRLVPLRKQT